MDYRNEKKVYTAIILIVLLCGGVLSANYIFLQRHMNEVLKEDPRNDGISVWVYYKWFVNSSEINYDLRSVSAENSSLDVSRVMLQFAEKVKDYDFSKVYEDLSDFSKAWYLDDFIKSMSD